MLKIASAVIGRFKFMPGEVIASIFFRRYLLGSNIYCIELPHLSRKNYAMLSGSLRNIYIGKRCWFGANVKFLGNNVLIASCVSFVGGDHQIDNGRAPMWESGRGDYVKPVVMSDDVWIGHGAIVLSGVTLARGTVVGAGSVLTKDTMPYGVYAGNPARLIRFRQ